MSAGMKRMDATMPNGFMDCSTQSQFATEHNSLITRGARKNARHPKRANQADGNGSLDYCRAVVPCLDGSGSNSGVATVVNYITRGAEKMTNDPKLQQLQKAQDARYSEYVDAVEVKSQATVAAENAHEAYLKAQRELVKYLESKLTNAH
jgi:hypothetical protein